MPFPAVTNVAGSNGGPQSSTLPATTQLLLTGSTATIAASGDVSGSTDTVAITKAFNAVVAAGGGTINLGPYTYYLNGSLPMAAGVVYQGSGFAVDSNEILNGGTILQGNGTFPCFAYNSTDLGSPLGSVAAFLAQVISGCGIKDLGIKNFSYGVKLGALYNPSVWHSIFRNICINSCTQWGLWCENFFTSQFDGIYAKNNANNIKFVASGTNILNGGNSELRHIYSATPTANGCGAGIAIHARGGSQINDIQMYDITATGQLSSSTQACTMSNGSANIGVTDLSKFQVGMPVTFTSSANGFFTGYIYFVTSVSASSGAGNITVIDRKTFTNLQATGNAAINILTQGNMQLEIGGIDSGSLVTYSGLKGPADVEAGGTARIGLGSCVHCNFDFGIISGNSSTYHIVERSCSNTTVHNQDTSVNVDLANDANILWIGVPAASYSFVGTGSGYSPIFQASTASAPTYTKGGMYYDTTLNKLCIGGATGWETVTSS